MSYEYKWSLMKFRLLGGILFFVSYLPYNMLLIWEEQLSWYHTVTSVSKALYK
jgi:hypothetical protein